MKKIIVLLSIAAVLLTSCLGEGNRNYSESSSIVYIYESETGITNYGLSLNSGRIITSSKMQEWQPATFKQFSFSWDEAYGQKSIDEFVVDSVAIAGEVKNIDGTIVLLAAPPVIEDPVKFVNLNNPFYINDKTLGDNWLFEYTYEAAKVESGQVLFYHDQEEETEGDVILIHVSLTVDNPGTNSYTDVVAVNMSQIRALYEGNSSTTTKDLKIKFRYYPKSQSQPVDSQVFTLRVAGD